MADDVVKRVRVTGKVQGVSFRAFARTQAERRGVDGWVRNEPDGSVRALLSGPASAVAALIEDLREGPAAADVAEVEIAPGGDAPRARGFTIEG